MRGTQGLAVTPDGRTLYASDYGGLYRIDVASKEIAPLAVPADLTLAGVDGLAYAGRTASSRSRTGSGRIGSSCSTSRPTASSIAQARILEMNHPAFDEPTLGTVVDGVLYFTANNQGHRYYDAKNPPKPEDLQDAVILTRRPALTFRAGASMPYHRSAWLEPSAFSSLSPPRARCSPRGRGTAPRPARPPRRPSSPRRRVGGAERSARAARAGAGHHRDHERRRQPRLRHAAARADRASGTARSCCRRPSSTSRPSSSAAASRACSRRRFTRTTP